MHFLSSKVALNIAKKKDLPFKKREFPKLTDLCVDVIVKNFDKYPGLEGVPQYYKNIVYENLGLDFPMNKLAKHVDSEVFWKNSCVTKWNILTLPPEHVTWKAAFFSNYLQHFIESMEHYEESQSELIDIIKVMASSVFRLRVNKIKTDMDLFDTIGKLTELQFLRLTLCKKDLVGDFSNNNMGIKLNELHQIASCLPVLKNLSLELVCNSIDDDGVKVLLKSLEEHPSLTHLDLSHNRISNAGARRIARVLKKNKNITSLDLTNNQIGYEGARCLSVVLGNEASQLKRISLKLNFISDKALALMLDDMKSNASLSELDLSANLLTDEVGEILKYVNTINSTLKKLRVSSNKYTNDSYEEWKKGLLQNKSLDEFEINGNDMLPERENELNEIIIKKYLTRIDVTFISNKGLEDFISKKNEKKEEPSDKGADKSPNKGVKEKEKPVEEAKPEENAVQA